MTISNKGPRDDRWYLNIMAPNTKGNKFAWLDPTSIYINESLGKARVWGGMEDYIDLMLEQELAVTIPRGQAKYIKATMDINKGIEAPLSAGDVLGKVIITLDTDVILEQNLVANQDMVHGGFIKGLIDGVTRVIMGE